MLELKAEISRKYIQYGEKTRIINIRNEGGDITIGNTDIKK